MNIYLASTSPRRRALLRQLGLKPRLLKPAFVEPDAGSLAPEVYALKCAKAKVLSCCHRVRSGLVIGVDTVVALGRSVLGKPADRSDARRMLKLLSGRTHRVVSGVAVLRLPERRMLSGLETTSVGFRHLSSREIEDYILRPEPYDKAGAYAIQGRAKLFVRKVSGCYLNVIGLPVPLLFRILHRSGWRSRSR